MAKEAFQWDSFDVFFTFNRGFDEFEGILRDFRSLNALEVIFRKDFEALLGYCIEKYLDGT